MHWVTRTRASDWKREIWGAEVQHLLKDASFTNKEGKLKSAKHYLQHVAVRKDYLARQIIDRTSCFNSSSSNRATSTVLPQVVPPLRWRVPGRVSGCRYMWGTPSQVKGLARKLVGLVSAIFSQMFVISDVKRSGPTSICWPDEEHSGLAQPPHGRNFCKLQASCRCQPLFGLIVARLISPIMDSSDTYSPCMTAMSTNRIGKDFQAV